jgi:hypothetical protein
MGTKYFEMMMPTPGLYWRTKFGHFVIGDLLGSRKKRMTANKAKQRFVFSRVAAMDNRNSLSVNLRDIPPLCRIRRR